jgi:hypothetical protein
MDNLEFWLRLILESKWFLGSTVSVIFGVVFLILKLATKWVDNKQNNNLIAKHLANPKQMKKALEDVGDFNTKGGKKDSKQITLPNLLKRVD